MSDEKASTHTQLAVPRIPVPYPLAISQVKDYAVFMVDPQGRTASWNEGVRQVLGWEEKDWIGQNIRVTFPPEDREDSDRELETARRESSANDDRWLIRRDGTRFFANGYTTAIFEGRQLVAYLKVLRDQTAHHQYEEVLKEADRRKDEFLATLAHELRNPLAPLRTGLQIMRTAYENPEMLERVRVMMERQLGFMVHLIDDLMDISRITRGRLELRLRPLTLATVIDAALEMSRSFVEAEGHELIVRLPQEPVRLNGDLTRLAQVFSNLVINAAKYTERGGKIVLEARIEPREVVVAVSDNGVGIPQESLATIFEMFSQAEANLPRQTRGLGIGLGLARALVQMHDGTISATSTGLGKGSTFTVRLPQLTE